MSDQELQIWELKRQVAKLTVDLKTARESKQRVLQRNGELASDLERVQKEVRALQRELFESEKRTSACNCNSDSGNE